MIRSARWFPLWVFVGGVGVAHGEMPGAGLETAKADMQLIPNEQRFDGVVEAVKQSTVAAQITGRISDVLFDVDDVVQKNAVLLRIHDVEYKARQKQAHAAVSEAQARLKEAEIELKRVEKLFVEKMVAESELDKAKTAAKAASARVQAAEGQVSEVEEQVENTVVRAPYSGIVVKRLVEVGETVRAGQAVMTGFSLDQLRVNVDVPQASIDAVRQFKNASVYNAAGEAISSKSMTVFPYADSASHAFKVRVDLAGGIKSVYPGMLVKVGFVVAQHNRLMVPSNAIVRRVEVEAVYVVDDKGAITMRQVRSGRSFDGKTEILAGLDAGENVALDPLRAGAMLKERAGVSQ